MDEDNFKKMMDVNGGQKVIPTIVIDEKVLTAYDRRQLKKALSIE